jgi:hypothetical protein
MARVAAACSAIVRADGLAGFYAGLLPNMLQVRRVRTLLCVVQQQLHCATGNLPCVRSHLAA